MAQLPPSPANDAPLIDERAASCGRTEMECGDEHAGVRRTLCEPDLERVACRSLFGEHYVSQAWYPDVGRHK
jgi:hypothetical protein